MSQYIAAIVSVLIVSGMVFTARWLVRRTNTRIWNIRAIDRFGFYLPYVTFAVMALLFASMRLKLDYVVPVSITLMFLLLIISIILNASLPFSLAVNYISGIIEKYKSRPKKDAPNPQRRLFLKYVAASVPAVVVGTTGTGFAGGFQSVRIPEINMQFNDLPDALDGFKILHLSDLHLGYYYQLEDLENLLLRLENKKFDLVLLTGDIADDLSGLPDALKLIDQMSADAQKFMSLGNHEYYRGIRDVLKIAEAGPVELLRSTGREIKLPGADLFAAGADDPVNMHSDISSFMMKTTADALDGSSADSFKILMSHRPRALDTAERFGVNLVLAGHTHGGQIGFRGRSLFNEVMKERYLWGEYQKGNTKLYTSSGVGHWFPFRLGCPAEAPIITLNKKA